jgi:hypothetical protein
MIAPKEGVETQSENQDQLSLALQVNEAFSRDQPQADRGLGLLELIKSEDASPRD